MFVFPVSDVGLAKALYSRLGWRLDADRAAGNAFRLVQSTPPGSGSGVHRGFASGARGAEREIEIVIDFGGRGRNRTYNLSVKSRMLCQLSYASMRAGWPC